MLLRLILASLAIASVSAQNCIPGAEPDGNGGCQCSTGMTGNPELCCHSDQNSKSCYVAGDPVLTSFSGNKIGLGFPCGTMISSSQTDASNPVVNVFAGGREMSTGTVYTSQVIVQIRQLAVITLTLNFDSTPGTLKYERSDGSPESYVLTDGVPMSLNQDGIQGDLIVTYLAPVSLYIVVVGGMSINVRPSLGNDPEQPYSPGVCVIEPTTSLKPSPGSTYACSLDTDITNKPVIEYLEYAIQPMKNYIFNQGILKEATYPEFDNVCQRYQDTMVNFCDAADRYNAMKKCAFILFHPTIKRCFFEGKAGLMEAFMNCSETYCRGTKTLCEGIQGDLVFQQCASNLMDCHTWPPYRRVNRFVAGEGDNEQFGPGDENNQGSETTQWSPPDGWIVGDEGEQDNGFGGGVNPDFEIPF